MQKPYQEITSWNVNPSARTGRKNHTGFFWSLKERWRIVLKKKGNGYWIVSQSQTVNKLHLHLISKYEVSHVVHWRLKWRFFPLKLLDVEKQWLCNTGNHPRWKMAVELIRSLTDTVLAQTAPLRRSLGPQAWEGKDGEEKILKEAMERVRKNGCLKFSKNDLDASWSQSLLHPPRCNI